MTDSLDRPQEPSDEKGPPMFVDGWTFYRYHQRPRRFLPNRRQFAEVGGVGLIGGASAAIGQAPAVALVGFGMLVAGISLMRYAHKVKILGVLHD